MIIECTNCHARYQYDEDRFERKASKKIKCAKCGSVFEIHNPAFSAKKAAAADNDTTASRHDETSVTKLKPKVEDTTAQSPLPKTEPEPPTAELPKGKRLSLAIIDGSDAGNVFRINKPRVTIGRSNADFVINDTEASRQHAAIEVRDTTYMLSDLSSTNGTLVDGKKITEPVELLDKSEFQIGTTTLMLIVTDEA